ncbi:MAG TPA: GNAT family N-acetyltransferase [Stellaceae bacterium]|nr:GNAT family N-acetyltransferase [Stellaceae bacterium]
MAIAYAREPDLSATEFRDVLVASSLGARRPVDDLARLERMLRHADIVVAARDGARLVGVSRAISDFAYCCYLSDLAVDVAYQRHGIGKRLIDETRQAAGEDAALILVAAPAAQAYYPKIGMVPIASGWMISRTR